MYMLSNRFNLFRFLAILALWYSITPLVAQESSLPSVFKSPYEAVYNHLKYLQEESLNPEQAAKSLAVGNRDEQMLLKLSIELKQIFDGSGNLIRLENVPRAADYTDSLTQRKRYILVSEFPDIYVEKSKWGVVLLRKNCFRD